MDGSTAAIAPAGPLQSDERALLQGRGRYLDDLPFAGAARGVVLRSPHAHARIRAIDVRRAAAMPGILAILTAADIVSLARPIPCVLHARMKDGSRNRNAPRPILAQSVVRHVGEPVAFVVAEDEQQARDAAERIETDYEVLAAVVDARAALEDGAVELSPEVPGNLCFDWSFGDEEVCGRAFAEAARVVTMPIRNNRVVVHPMETRSAVATYDPAGARFTLVTGTQGVHLVRDVLADAILGMDRSRLEVLTPDVGGAFGAKIFVYPEQVLVLLAAQRLGRPVKWVAERWEGFVSDTQARAHHSEAELALDADGHFLGLRVETTADLGAYVSMYAPYVAAECGVPVICGAYRIPRLFVRVRAALTNSVPVDAYRGAGRPEATYLLERLIDKAAGDCGIDRAELRRRNLATAEEMPLRTASGITLEGGSFADNLRRALDAADYRGFAARRRDSRQRGRLRGIGFATYLETNGGLGVARGLHPGGIAQEAARLRIAGDSEIDLWVGTQSTGQRHHQVLAGLLAARLGLDAERLRVRQGESAALSFGGGTGGSRSLIANLAALEALTAEVRRVATARAAALFAVAEDDIVERDGVFQVDRTNRSIGLLDLVAGSGTPLDVEVRASYHSGTQANGCHLSEVEVDPETGRVKLLRYLAVDDFGRVLDRDAVFGQVCGGIAQGVGQALHEQCLYDPASGQLLSGSLMDYTLPRADDLPAIEWIANGRPAASNSLGIKACGESGASAAPPAVMNAVADALAGLVPAERVQMPATPFAVYGWLQAARS